MKKHSARFIFILLLVIFAAQAYAAPDVLISNTWISSGSTDPLTDFTITYSIKNQGSTDVSSSFRTQLVIDGSNIGPKCTRNNIPVGESRDCQSIAINLAAGSHDIQIIADVDSQLTESNEGNNIYSDSLQVGSAPEYDLYVTQITPSNSNPIDGETFDIDYTVKNGGTDSVTDSFSTKLYIDDNAVTGDVPRTGITAGGIREFTKYSISLSQGTHSIKVVTDSKSEISETDEGNNEKTIYITVGAAADPCQGVSCDDYCSGTTLNNNGYCSGGTCNYDIEPMSTSCGYDACAFTICEDFCSGTTLFINTGCNAGTCLYSREESSPSCTSTPVDPCEGVTCSDTCEGTTLKHSGTCSDGTCQYSLEPLSTSCGYDACAFMLCEDYCSGTTLFRGTGCSDGQCDFVQESSSTSCGYIPPVPTDNSYIVVLDPGHTNTSTEGIINDKLSDALKLLLEAEGFTVYETDSSLDVNQRADYADSMDADILLSIHFNAFDGNTEGVEAFYYDADDEVLCDTVLPYIEDILPSTNRGVKPDTSSAPGSLGVLRSRNGTACLVEMEFLDRVRDITFMETNYTDFSTLLNSDDYISTAAEALKDGILDHFNMTSTAPNPCQDVICDDKCTGTTWNYDGQCSMGTCQYSLEPLSTTCGYDSCVFLLCENFCSGTTLFTNTGCNAGTCLYSREESSPTCNYIPPDPCQGVTCDDYCDGTTRVSFGTCSLGACNYASRTDDSTICGWTDDTNSTTNNTEYFINNINSIPDIYQKNSSWALNYSGLYHCGPSASTNILVWLYQSGFTNLSTGTESEALNSTVWILSEPNYTNANKPQGVDPINLAGNITKYIKERGYIVDDMKFQGMKTVYSEHKTNVTAPELDWIKEGIRESNSAVLLHYSWFRYDSSTDRYTRLGGHWATAVGYGKDADGNNDSNFLIIHDPITKVDRNEYINMTEIDSGTFLRAAQSNATGFYIMDGATTSVYAGTDYAILEGALRFKISKPKSPPASVIATAIIGSTGGSSSGGGSSSSYEQQEVIIEPIEPQAVNPALAFILPKADSTTASLEQTAGATSEAGSSSSSASADTQTIEEATPASTVVPLTIVGTECSSNADCSSGETCLPSGTIQRIFTTPKCCPIGYDLVDGKCVAPEIVGYDEECSDDVSCRTGLTCVSTASWYSIFNRDAGVCCLPGEDQEDGSCLSNIMRSIPVN